MQRVVIAGVHAFFSDKDVKSTASMRFDTYERAEGGQDQRDTVLVELKDGRTFRLVRDAGWNDKDHNKGKRLANAYIAAAGLTHDDLTNAFISTGINPGVQLINNSPKGTRYTAAICKTDRGEFVIWYDDPEG